jgi:hypothetical protein
MSQNSHNDPANKPFVTEKDVQVFRDNDDDLEKCIQAFQKEMPAFLRKRWKPDYESRIQVFETGEEPLTAFNQLIGNYPSHGGYAILDDMFTFVDEEDMDLLSENTYQILSYFYGFHFH